MVAKIDYRGPRALRDDRKGRIETGEMCVVVDPVTLTSAVHDSARGPNALTLIRPVELSADQTVLTIAPGPMQHVYGLGEQFVAPGEPNGDWVGRVRTPGNEFGNDLVRIDGGTGNVGNAQFPVMYALGPAGENYALFLDHLYAQTWDFTGSPWRVETRSGLLRWYVMTGPNLPDLRSDYLELVGRPPVPPKKMFGMWVSEYGYEDWAELEDKLATLDTGKFPVDGFVLDLQWFGGIQDKSEASRMGAVAWDTTKFPEPAKKLAELRERHGVGIMTIEEPYVSRGLPDYALLAERGYLVRQGAAEAPPVHLINWWGAGGMVDWTNPAAGDYWHDSRRQALIQDGVLAHWTDLGEPEAFDANGWYYGDPQRDLHTQRDAHNLYNFLWAASIHRGYARNQVARRPFIMSRSGTSGIQRFGTAMWSGDIGSRLRQLAAHFNTQMHMSFSGVDYYGADVGGFNREVLDGDLNEMYTQWFAAAAAFDVPLRPHTANTVNRYETAPDRVGDPISNLLNLRQRYELIPYLYSLAHEAWRFGLPVVTPPVFYYQNDPNVPGLGAEKMLGGELLIAAVAEHGQQTTDVYLPAGTWFDYHTHERHESTGVWMKDVPLYRDSRFRLPMYARAGAIIPLMPVDEQTMNAVGRRRDGSRRDELIIRVFADVGPWSSFLYEDDGETTAYQHGDVRRTLFSQATDERGAVRVLITRAVGSYQGALESRNNLVDLISGENRAAGPVLLNDQPLEHQPTKEAFDRCDRGWFDAGAGRIHAKSGVMSVGEAKVFTFEFAKD